MTIAKTRSLQIRPSQSADLAFESAGVIGAQGLTAKLGEKVKPFDIGGRVHAHLRDTVTGNPSRLRFDSAALRQLLSPESLFSLRNESLAVSLDQAVVHRGTAFIQKFQHASKIAQLVQETYATTAAGKIPRLVALRDALAEQRKELLDAYEAEKVAVVKAVPSRTLQKGKTSATTYLTAVAMQNTQQTIKVTGAVASDHAVSENQVVPQRYEGGGWKPIILGDLAFQSQRTDTDHDLTIDTSSTTPEFRHPKLESKIGELRSQIDLLDEILRESIVSLSASDVPTLIANEALALDLEISKHQIRYVETFLVAPFAGVVTAIYKDVGEAVLAGEPVLRIDNADRILVVGLLQCREALFVGRKVRIDAPAAYESSSAALVEGTLVAVRGHDSDNDEWDVIIEAENRACLPINYHFDRDTARVEFL